MLIAAARAAERMRSIGFQGAAKCRQPRIADRLASDAYREARDDIRCAFPLCRCPAAGGYWYAFRYVDESRRAIYHEVPKCASTTLRRTLFDGAMGPALRNPVRPRDEYFRFAFVRNPWDRMVSNWTMFTTRERRRSQIRSLAGTDVTEFADFVRFATTTVNHHWLPQSAYVPADVDFVGRLERFDDDFAVVADRLGITGVRAGRANTTEHASYTSYYTGELAELVGGYYAADVERFAYEFGDPVG